MNISRDRLSGVLSAVVSQLVVVSQNKVPFLLTLPSLMSQPELVCGCERIYDNMTDNYVHQLNGIGLMDLMSQTECVCMINNPRMVGLNKHTLACVPIVYT